MKRMKTAIMLAVSLAFAAGWGAERTFAPLSAGRPRPADFDEYWDGEMARQRETVPLDAAKVKIVELKDAAKTHFVYDVEIPAMSPTPARGLLTVPKNAAGTKMPVVVATQGAGTMRTPVVCYPKAVGFALSPYGELNREADPHYHQLFRTKLNDYPHRGWESRETCWFHGQIMRLVRALEWVKTRPEWDRKNLIVHGKSMGGSQALQAGALDKDVTVCAPEDPAMCDHAGGLAAQPRKAGWPQICEWAKNCGKKAETIERYLWTADYFDNCNFASRIKCKAYFASGYCDRVCPSEGVFMAYDRAKGEKLLTVDPQATHCKTVNRPFLEELRRLTGK